MKRSGSQPKAQNKPAVRAFGFSAGVPGLPAKKQKLGESTLRTQLIKVVMVDTHTKNDSFGHIIYPHTRTTLVFTTILLEEAPGTEAGINYDMQQQK